jgi:energy-coupling factor transport system permease protein
MSFDLYVARPSWLHTLDPRVKLLLVVLSTALLLTLRNLYLFLAFLILYHLMIFSAGIPASRVRWAWRVILPPTILIPLLWPLFYREGGPVLLQLGPLRVSALSWWEGVAMAVRLDALAFAFFTWLFSTDQTSLVRGFVRLGLPFEWGLMLAIALRYVPTFYGAFVTISEAQAARGLVISQRNFVKRVRAYLPVLVAMIISALRTSDKLAIAMASRALGLKGVKRTYLRDVRFRPADYVYVALLIAIFFVLLALRFQFGFGTHLLRLF